MKRTINIQIRFYFTKTIRIKSMHEAKSVILEKISRTLSAHDEIVAAYVFGSYAKGYERPDSDLDIGLLLTHDEEGGGLYPERIAGELKDALQTKRDIDVRILNRGTLRFLHQVLNGRLIFCRDDKKRIEFETSTIRKYLDFKPFLEEYDRMRKERILLDR